MSAVNATGVQIHLFTLLESCSFLPTLRRNSFCLSSSLHASSMCSFISSFCSFLQYTLSLRKAQSKHPWGQYPVTVESSWYRPCGLFIFMWSVRLDRQGPYDWNVVSVQLVGNGVIEIGPMFSVKRPQVGFACERFVIENWTRAPELALHCYSVRS